MGVPPKSSILAGFSIINYPFWGTPVEETTIWVLIHQDMGENGTSGRSVQVESSECEARNLEYELLGEA